MASCLLAAAALMLLSRNALAEEAEIDTKQGTIKVQTLRQRTRATLGASPSCPTGACS